MALPTIIINSSTGSDTAASGAGPSVALTGSLAQTLSNTTVNITDGGVSLAGVAIDGSAVLWVSTASGRQFSAITNITGSIGAYVVTVITTYSVTATGQTWGIGGQRATLASSIQLGLDVRGGWTIDVQTNQTLTAGFRLAPNAVAGIYTTFTSTVGTKTTTITTSTNSIPGLDIGGSHQIIVSNLYFSSTAATRGDGIRPVASFGNGGANGVILSNIVIDGFNVGASDFDSGQNGPVIGFNFDRVEIKNCVNYGYQGIGRAVNMSGCYIHNNNTGGSGNGGMIFAPSQGGLALENCIFDSNKVANLVISIGSGNDFPILLGNCNLTNAVVGGANTGHGLDITSNSGGSLVMKNCIIYGNVGYGLHTTLVTSGQWLDVYEMTNNAFGANALGNSNNSVTLGANVISLSGNPFVSSSDFGLNSTAGASCKQVGVSQVLLSATATAPDIGAVQSGGSGSSGGISIF